MTFHVGQKVVCVDDSPPPGKGYQNEVLPREGEVYTIRSIETRMIRWTANGPSEESVCLRLHEIINAEAPYFDFASGGVMNWEPSFRASRFRPLIERKTSIEIFEQIRRDVEKRIPELV